MSPVAYWKSQEMNPALKAANPEYNGRADLRTHEGQLVELRLEHCAISDLTPIKGMQIKSLHCGHNPLTDLSPLKGMPLETLFVWHTPLFDISVVKSLPLKYFSITNTQVSDLSPLAGLKLETLSMDGSQVTDATPLAGMQIKRMSLTPRRIVKGLEVIRGMESIHGIGLEWHRQMPPAQFWAKYDAGEFGWPPGKAPRPPARAEYDMAYVGGSKVVMFGGDGYWPELKLDDTWEYDTKTHRWTEYTRRGPTPLARSWNAMAYCGGTKLVMFGGHGVGRGRELLQDTWEYDGQARRWTRIDTGGREPQPRNGHALAYLGGSKVLLYGGWTVGGRYLTDTWEYDAATRQWTPITVQGQSPPIRGDFPMAYLSNGRVILFGGSFPAGGLSHRNDTWVYDGAKRTWTKTEAEGETPPPRCDGALAHLAKGKVLLFGGWQDRQDRIFDDTWEYDAQTQIWQLIEIRGPKPARRHIHAMSRAGNGTVVLFGGSSKTDETWEYEAAGRTWQEFRQGQKK